MIVKRVCVCVCVHAWPFKSRL